MDIEFDLCFHLPRAHKCVGYDGIRPIIQTHRS